MFQNVTREDKSFSLIYIGTLVVKFPTYQYEVYGSSTVQYLFQ